MSLNYTLKNTLSGNFFLLNILNSGSKMDQLWNKWSKLNFPELKLKILPCQDN